MTRQDLVNKSIDKLNTVKEALELIEILEYDECIAVLTGTKNLPSEIHSALMRRGKEAKGCMSSHVGAYRTGVLIMGKSTSRGGFSETKRTANMFSRWIFDTFSRVLTMMS